MRTRLSALLMAALCSPSAPAAPDHAALAHKLAADAPVRVDSVERGAIPSNDACSGAIVISTLPFSHTVNTADALQDVPPGSCNAGGALVMQNSVWYRWTCPENCAATFTATDLTNYDVIVAAYSGPSCVSIVEFACADEPEPATLTFNAVKNTTYWFKVGDWGVSPGGGGTTVSLTTLIPNESCDSAVLLTDADHAFTVNTAVANAGPGITNCGFPGSIQTQNDAWYTFEAPTACTVTVTATPAGFDGILALYWNFGDCNVLVGATCTHSTGTMTRTIQLDAGEAMSIRLGSYALTPVGGPVALTFTARAANDDCAGAEFIDCNSVTDVHTTFGSNAPAEPLYPCAPGSASGTGVNSLWYRFIPTTPSVRLRTLPVLGQPQDTVMAVYAGSCASLTQIACNDDDFLVPDPATSQIDLNSLTVGAQYYVRVSAYNAANVGHCRLAIECPPNCAPCAFDAVAEAEPCGENLNAGCSANPAAYQDIPYNAHVCGAASLSNQNGTLIGDLDAYRVTLNQPGTLEWTVTAQFPVTVSMLAPGCPSNVLTTTSGPSCTPVTISLPQPAGEAIVIVRPTTTAGSEPFPCGSINRYSMFSAFTPACLGDLNGDGVRNTADLVIFIGDFGLTGAGIASDLNHDGLVSTPDLTIFLGRFGEPCP